MKPVGRLAAAVQHRARLEDVAIESPPARRRHQRGDGATGPRALERARGAVAAVFGVLNIFLMIHDFAPPRDDH
jgi:hypothetical protein